MLRKFGFSLLIILIFSSMLYAGFGSYDNPYSSDSVVAPIQIKDKGIYNLVVSVQFMNKPYDKKIYESDEYEKYLQRLKVEWSGVALAEMLNAKEQGINDLVTLKVSIENVITNLAEKLKSRYSMPKDVEVVFALANFYIIEPKKITKGYNNAIHWKTWPAANFPVIADVSCLMTKCTHLC
jgi:hypothetical protein